MADVVSRVVGAVVQAHRNASDFIRTMNEADGVAKSFVIGWMDRWTAIEKLTELGFCDIVLETGQRPSASLAGVTYTLGDV